MNATALVKFREPPKTTIAEYQKRVKAKALRVRYSMDVWEGYDVAGSDSIYWNCYEVDPEDPPDGFTIATSKKSTKVKSYQYSVYIDNKRTRPKAYRIPFLTDPNYLSDAYTVSHLCHNKKCYNWKHLCLETLDQNKARNGCPGGAHCHHFTTHCMRPGPFYSF